jgi:hypothetical protein
MTDCQPPERIAQARAVILEAFGVTETDLDQLETETGWNAARAEADLERARYWAWAQQL